MSAIEFTTSSEVFWIVCLKINPGREADFRAHSARLVESTRQEAGALNYEWSVSGEGDVCHIYERYRDSAAVKVHVQRNIEMIMQLSDFTTFVNFVMYGSPDEEVKQLFARRTPVFMEPLSGFRR